MSSGDAIVGSGRTIATGTSPARLPAGCVELAELASSSIDHEMGYFRSERFVIFGYCPGGGEVVWKDGISSGFGTGGWRVFLEEIAPLAARRGASIGGATSAGTHVLLMDRVQGVVYAVPREAGDAFLAEVCGLPPPTRRCLCSLMDCAACPARSGATGRGGHAGTA